MPTPRPVILSVRLGPPIGMMYSTFGLLTCLISPTIIPFLNHKFIGGGWVLDIIGAILGVMVIISMNQVYGSNPTRKQFQNAEDAAEWVKTFGPPNAPQTTPEA